MAIKNYISLVTQLGTNEQSNATPITVTSSGVSREFRELGSFQRAILLLNVTAASGTNPTLTVALQAQDPVSLVWMQVAMFNAQTAASSTQPLGYVPPITLELYGLAYRTSWTVGGTSPSFTFSFGAIAGAEEPII